MGWVPNFQCLLMGKLLCSSLESHGVPLQDPGVEPPGPPGLVHCDVDLGGRHPPALGRNEHPEH